MKEARDQRRLLYRLAVASLTLLLATPPVLIFGSAAISRVKTNGITRDAAIAIAYILIILYLVVALVAGRRTRPWHFALFAIIVVVTTIAGLAS
jgi:hypothetical protein